MTGLARSAALVLSTGFGLLMVGLVVPAVGSSVGPSAVGSHGPAVAAGAAALIAVGVGVVFRPAATVAVLLLVATVLVSNPSVTFAAWSGLCAAAYLVLSNFDAVRLASGNGEDLHVNLLARLS